MILDKVIEKRSTSKSIRVFSHVLFWTVLLVSSYYIIKSSYSIYNASPLAYLIPIRQLIGQIIVFYPLMYLLIPQFLIKKKWGGFLLYFVLLFFLYTVFEAFGEKLTFELCGSCRFLAQEINPDHLSVLDKPIIDNILYKASNIGLYFNLFSSLVLPIAIKSSLGYYQVSVKNLQLEKEKVQLELNFLKAQVNPHFLFNTLNNLYGLIIHKRADASAETVTRLSDFMRYSLENAHKKSIQLSEEIKLLQNYIELESLRLNHTKVSFVLDVDENNVSLPPLLFIPLVENAFKYNTDKKDTNLVIDLSVKNAELQLTIQNVFDPKKAKNENGGLGLSNLKKRLGLYFSDKYKYEVQIENSVYTVTLKLVLK